MRLRSPKKSASKYEYALDSVEVEPSVWKIIGLWPGYTPTVPKNTVLILQSEDGEIAEQKDVPKQARSLVEVDELNLLITEVNDLIQVSRLSFLFSCCVLLFCLGISFYLWISVFPLIYNDFPIWLNVIFGLVFGLILGGCSIKSYSFCLQLHLHKGISELVKEYNDDRRFVQDGEWKEECIGNRVFLYLVLPNETEKLSSGIKTFNERTVAALIKDSSNSKDLIDDGDEEEYLL